MKLKLAAATITAALAAGLLTGPVPANAAPVLPATSPPGTYKADIDGDGKKDTVTITLLGSTEVDKTWEIHVLTAKHKSSWTYWDTQLNVTWPLDRFASIDPVKGKELVLVADDDYELNAHGMVWTVLTWRHNTLRAEKAPWSADYKAGTSTDWGWFTDMNDPLRKEGFREYTSRHKRYSENFNLTWNTANSRWEGYIRRSLWKSGSWHNNKITKVKLTEKQAARYPRIDIDT